MPDEYTLDVGWENRAQTALAIRDPPPQAWITAMVMVPTTATTATTATALEDVPVSVGSRGSVLQRARDRLQRQKQAKVEVEVEVEAAPATAATVMGKGGNMVVAMSEEDFWRSYFY